MAIRLTEETGLYPKCLALRKQSNKAHSNTFFMLNIGFKYSTFCRVYSHKRFGSKASLTYEITCTHGIIWAGPPGKKCPESSLPASSSPENPLKQ